MTKRQIILDTETTGLSPQAGHRIIEIGCIEMINRRQTGNHFHHYINPDRPVEREASEVHGITDAFLQDKPRFSQIVEDFVSFVKGAELVIHNAPFDIGFLNHELSLLKSGWPEITQYCEVLDTLQLARQMHPGQRNSLDALCKRYDVSNSHRELHGALLDAELLALVYLAMTGGQEALQFGESQTQGNTKIQQTVKTTTQHESLKTPVIQANTEELEAHEQLMKLLKNAHEAPVSWD